MMVIEMASAFLLVENIIDHFSGPADDLDAQIVIMGGWLLDAAKGKSNGEPPAGLRPDLTERIGALQFARTGGAGNARQPAARRAGDRRVRARSEQARRAGRAQALSAPDARRAFGARLPLGGAGDLDLRGADAGAGARRTHRGATTSTGSPRASPASASSSSPAATGASPRRRRSRSSSGATKAQRAGRRRRRGSPEGRAGAWPSRAATAAAPPPGVDPELLQVFLDEAVEVLQTIEQTLPECKQKPDDRESLTTVRRAFHTLKAAGAWSVSPTSARRHGKSSR